MARQREPDRGIQWATGAVEMDSIAAIHANPNGPLVGGSVHSASPVGRGAGDIAGVGPIGVGATNPDAWRHHLVTSFFGAPQLVQACVSSTQARRDGRVGLVNRGGAFEPPPGLASDSARGAAMASLVRSTAIEQGPNGIRATGRPPRLGRRRERRQPDPRSGAAGRPRPAGVRRELTTQRYQIGHVSRSEECAGAVVFLASDLARAVTGQAIRVNGGEHLR
jgi:NAD(P)-dependent dehydrogenase (short-subunit alcohol dehydrogenase family)